MGSKVCTWISLDCSSDYQNEVRTVRRKSVISNNSLIYLKRFPCYVAQKRNFSCFDFLFCLPEIQFLNIFLLVCLHKYGTHGYRNVALKCIYSSSYLIIVLSELSNDHHGCVDPIFKHKTLHRLCSKINSRNAFEVFNCLRSISTPFDFRQPREKIIWKRQLA